MSDSFANTIDTIANEADWDYERLIGALEAFIESKGLVQEALDFLKLDTGDYESCGECNTIYRLDFPNGHC